MSRIPARRGAMRQLLSILLWSVIAAAFIGPGTVTTAGAAGAGHRYALLWALSFSTLACLVLQEASARLAVVSGHDLGRALRRQYPAGFAGTAVLVLVVGAIVVGCAAYEAGNILGGAAGAGLATGLSRPLLVALSGSIAALLLWFNAPHAVARLLSVLVALMGVAFLVTAWRLRPPLGELAAGALVPTLPAGSGVLALGLVGTTVVPYNLFLGAGLARGQRLREMRLGLAVAVILGGLISMGVVVAGTAVDGDFEFAALAGVLGDRLGRGGALLFSFGLFAAGLSSAVTAPLAAAVTTAGLFGDRDRRERRRWGERSWRYRAVWGGVLAVGVGFGFSPVRPIPAIVLAQALNGILLPLAAVFLLLAVNDRRLMGEEGLNGSISNLLMAAVTGATLLLGVSSVARAAARAVGREPPGQGALLAAGVAAALLLAFPVGRAVRRRRAAR